MNQKSHKVHDKMPKETSKPKEKTRTELKWCKDIHTSAASLREITATKYPPPPPHQWNEKKLKLRNACGENETSRNKQKKTETANFSTAGTTKEAN